MHIMEIVPLEGDSLSEAAMQYFDQSEQLPTFIRIAIDHVDGRCVIALVVVMAGPHGTSPEHVIGPPRLVGPAGRSALTAARNVNGGSHPRPTIAG